MKRRQRHILTALGIGLALCLLALACIPLYLNTDHAKAIAKRLINQNIPGELEWTSLHLSVFRGNAELQGLQIKGVGEADIAGFERLNISWGRICLRASSPSGVSYSATCRSTDVANGSPGSLRGPTVIHHFKGTLGPT